MEREVGGFERRSLSGGDAEARGAVVVGVDLVDPISSTCIASSFSFFPGVFPAVFPPSIAEPTDILLTTTAAGSTLINPPGIIFPSTTRCIGDLAASDVGCGNFLVQLCAGVTTGNFLDMFAEEVVNMVDIELRELSESTSMLFAGFTFSDSCLAPFSLLLLSSLTSDMSASSLCTTA